MYGLGDLYTYWFDFSILSIGQVEYEITDPRFRNFAKGARLADGSQIWLSDQVDRVLATVGIPASGAPVLTVHWGTIQTVAVNGR